jgi:hypothetical protein
VTRRLPPWLIFLLSFAALQAAWEGVRPSSVGRQWVEGVLVPASATVLRWAQPDLPVQVQGRKLHSPSGGITVQRGCEGMEFIAMGWAALLTLSLGARHAPNNNSIATRLQRMSLAWLVVTTGTVALSTLRLASLMWCRMAWPEALGLWHGLLTPVLMVLGTAALCAPWLRPGSPAVPAVPA